MGYIELECVRVQTDLASEFVFNLYTVPIRTQNYTVVYLVVEQKPHALTLHEACFRVGLPETATDSPREQQQLVRVEVVNLDHGNLVT